MGLDKIRVGVSFGLFLYDVMYTEVCSANGVP